MSGLETTLENAESLQRKFPGSAILNTSVSDASAKLAKVFHLSGADGAAATAADEGAASALDKIVDIGKSSAWG